MTETSAAPALRSLSPEFDPVEHGDYVAILEAELKNEADDAARNLALTGHYGSGKSSVLIELQSRLKKAGVSVINLSLPSLGIGDGRLPRGSDARDKTNLIQKEIVKQLLYRQSPSTMPASRYSRLDVFHTGPAYRRAATIALVVTGIALLFKLPHRLRVAFPPTFWSWLDAHLPWSPATTIQWLSLVMVFGLSLVGAVWTQRVLQRLRVTELAAGPEKVTKVTLSEGPSSSFFDEYLDEIVYFFQTSKTKVVIFEDLDRFKDPHIFETLRELNMLLNAAGQIEAKPIRFVYAIRDSIFEQLDENAVKDDADDAQTASIAEEEHRRLMATNRTKFFDLVVPMVPFISHRTSRKLIRQELEDLPEKHRPGNEVIDLVAAHLTDMRLIKNICNEYEVFQGRILGQEGLTELTGDRLFALMVYKNLYLADYEKIRHGDSQLDKLFAATQAWRSSQLSEARSAEQQARLALRRLDTIANRAQRLGSRLVEVLESRTDGDVQMPSTQVTFNGEAHDSTEFQTAEFWHAYCNYAGDLTIRHRSPYSSIETVTLTFKKLASLMRESLTPSDWETPDRTALDETIRNAIARQTMLTHISLADSLAETERTYVTDIGTETLEEVAHRVFKGSTIVLDLLRAGYIDENFTLYVVQYPGASSAAAANFALKAVQPDKMYIDFHFGSGPEVETQDIIEVLKDEGRRLFAGQSIYNREIFDYLLATRPNDLADPIRRLASSAGSSTEFIDAYLSAGKEAQTFVSMLSSHWPQLFTHLTRPESGPPDVALIDAALQGASGGTPYTVNDDSRAQLAPLLPHLKSLTAKQTPKRAAAIGRTLGRLGLVIDELSVVKPPLRDDIVNRDLYRLTLGNLRTITGDDQSLPLDVLRSEYGDTVYQYVLQHLREYLNILNSVSGVPTIAEPSAFEVVLSDVIEADSDLIEEVAERAAPSALLQSFGELVVSSWPAIVRAKRVTLSSTNVTAYLEQYGIDAGMAGYLAEQRHIAPTKEDPALAALAVQVINADAINADLAFDLVISLSLASGSLAAADLTTVGHRLLPKLLYEELLPDNADAFTCLADDEQDVKRALIDNSNEFVDYMSTLSLTANDLRTIASFAPDKVRQELLDGLDTYSSHLGRNGAASLAQWIISKGIEPDSSDLETLASRGGEAAARPIIELLGAQAATIDREPLFDTLNDLGGPYNQLTSTGWDRPKVLVTPGIRAVLARLQAERIAGKIEELREGYVRVNKRRR